MFSQIPTLLCLCVFLPLNSANPSSNASALNTTSGIPVSLKANFLNTSRNATYTPVKWQNFTSSYKHIEPSSSHRLDLVYVHSSSTSSTGNRIVNIDKEFEEVLYDEYDSGEESQLEESLEEIVDTCESESYSTADITKNDSLYSTKFETRSGSRVLSSVEGSGIDSILNYFTLPPKKTGVPNVHFEDGQLRFGDPDASETVSDSKMEFVSVIRESNPSISTLFQSCNTSSITRKRNNITNRKATFNYSPSLSSVSSSTLSDVINLGNRSEYFAASGSQTPLAPQSSESPKTSAKNIKLTPTASSKDHSIYQNSMSLITRESNASKVSPITYHDSNETKKSKRSKSKQKGIKSKMLWDISKPSNPIMLLTTRTFNMSSYSHNYSFPSNGLSNHLPIVFAVIPLAVIILF